MPSPQGRGEQQDEPPPSRLCRIRRWVWRVLNHQFVGGVSVHVVVALAGPVFFVLGAGGVAVWTGRDDKPVASPFRLVSPTNGAKVDRCVHIVADGDVPRGKVPITGVYGSQYSLPGGGKGAYFPSRGLIQPGPGGPWTTGTSPLAVGTVKDVGVVYQVWVGFAPKAFAEKLGRDFSATRPYTLEQLESEKVEILHPAVSVQRQRDPARFC